jgi:DNA invertase Pin-like site-specific DNA recombinase
MIRERVTAGLARAKAQGKKLGRPVTPPKVEAEIRHVLQEVRASGRRQRS